MNLLKKSKNIYPVYAIKTKPNDPDFITYDINKNEFKPIEILEILTPNRERSKEYKDSIKIVEPYLEKIKIIDNPWSSFITNLHNKFLKFYQNNCWLLIYHDMHYVEITNIGFWHNTLLAEVEKWERSNTVDFKKCTYEKIFVIDATAKALVCIHPERSVIVPSKNSRGKTIIL